MLYYCHWAEIEILNMSLTMETWRPSWSTAFFTLSFSSQTTAFVGYMIPQTQQVNSWWTGKWYIKSQGSVWLWQSEFDCSNIYRIVHIGPPYTTEEYCQEVGQTSRDRPTVSNLVPRARGDIKYDLPMTSQKPAKILLTQQQPPSKPRNTNKQLFWFCSWCSHQSTTDHYCDFHMARRTLSVWKGAGILVSPPPKKCRYCLPFPRKHDW